jgi:hypothetical protein
LLGIVRGGEPGGPDRDASQWRNVNDAEWGDLARAYRT